MMDQVTKLHKIHVLDFRVKDVHVCVDIRHVNKILPLLSLERVPDSPVYLVGLLNLEGKIIPVIDLAMRLNMERKETYNLDMLILLCIFETHHAGLLIDSINELVEIDKKEIQLHDKLDKKNSPFVGAITLKNNLSLLMDMEHLLPVKMH